MSKSPKKSIGLVLANLGTPEAPTKGAVRKFLAEFLSDTRVVELPRLIWLPILYGFILTTRPEKTAAAYAKVWREEGSPLMAIARKQATALQEELDEQFPDTIRVITAMRYGKPSISAAMDQLAEEGIKRIVILPQYPQYSATTTASIFDAVGLHLRKCRDQPELRWLRSYSKQTDYIDALAESIDEHWQQFGRGDRLLFSFHGIPKRCVDMGDPYAYECRQTAEEVADALQLKKNSWNLCFQSRFGSAEWLQPYTDVVLKSLPAKDVKKVDVICPGFAADCLETLEEVNIGFKEEFLAAGGEEFRYIAALNDRHSHINLLANLAEDLTLGWMDD